MKDNHKVKELEGENSDLKKQMEIMKGEMKEMLEEMQKVQEK
tara:strand:- start:537 stop:662 length:126 start_codon:yes stop_codon:yes gene_type:complete